MSEEYFKILLAFTRNEVSYIAIGTWALKLAYPEVMKDYQITDCDVVIKNDIEQIRQSIQILQNQEWKVMVWEEEIEEEVSMGFLKDKFYLRATKENHTLDLTYENVLFSFREMEKQSIRHDSYFLGSLEHILALKKCKGSPKDLQTITLFKDLISSKIN